MKRNQRMEIKQKTKDELVKAIRDARLELGRLRVDLASRKVHNTGNLKELKKNIARMKTAYTDKVMEMSMTDEEKPEVTVETKASVKKVSKKKEDVANA